MGRATYVLPDGARRELDLSDGTSLMQAAVSAGIDGIVAECGGSAMCATCHVYVDEADVGRPPPIGGDEDEMLECTVAERLPTSRLSCQLVMALALDGIMVRIPEEQV